jgi:hypothetical protein
MIELIVELDPMIERDGYWSIVVRCATDICKGDTLLRAIPYSVASDYEDGTSLSQIDDAAFPVDLIVDRILSWGKEWEAAYSGMAVKIFVEGDASKIRARTVLRNP